MNCDKKSTALAYTHTHNRLNKRHTFGMSIRVSLFHFPPSIFNHYFIQRKWFVHLFSFNAGYFSRYFWAYFSVRRIHTGALKKSNHMKIGFFVFGKLQSNFFLFYSLIPFDLWHVWDVCTCCNIKILDEFILAETWTAQNTWFLMWVS